MKASSVLVLTLLSPLASLRAAKYYVAPNGDDARTGSKEQPFATLHQTQLAARKARAQGQPVTVFLRGGTHYLTKPLVFEPQDSGTKEAPVV